MSGRLRVEGTVYVLDRLARRAGADVPEPWRVGVRPDFGPFGLLLLRPNRSAWQQALACQLHRVGLECYPMRRGHPSTGDYPVAWAHRPRLWCADEPEHVLEALAGPPPQLAAQRRPAYPPRTLPL